ncbi:hypothetical protein [Dyella silvatica]|uniref:hypothetical protein n=1 Tax=Dyella silvatica TaxID=2992128 RepID=UPI002256B142|nr:hypothetical protein [Dyella silvatica]
MLWKTLMAATFLMPLVAGYNTAFAQAISVDVPKIVEAAMKNQYGNHYDTKHSCWEFSSKSEQGNVVAYCMRPSEPELVTTAVGAQVYFYAVNANDIDHVDKYLYAPNDPGLMGAFKIQIDAKGDWTYVAFDNAMAYGTNGTCGCNKAKFVKLSNKGDYGWLFTSGGVWQGTVVADYSILVARGDGFADISSIPEITEAAQDIKYEVKVSDGATGDAMFPLLVTKKKSGVEVDSFLVKYDSKKKVYALPKGK